MDRPYKIIKQFDIKGTISSIEACGSGHIHNTFRVATREADCDDYILQELNTRVFTNIEQLQHNITLVTSHIIKKLNKLNSPDIKRKVLTVVKSVYGEPFLRDDNGKYWRVYVYIRDHRSYNTVFSLQHASEAGRAIGQFQSWLTDLDSRLLYETIPHFHDIEKRLHTFNKSVNADIAGRVKHLSNEIGFIKERSKEMSRILDLGRQGLIPSRITHNDTKLNNILFDANDKAMCVIDLDTVMAGYIHYDYGDAIRTTATHCSEDERDLDKVELDLNLFKAYTDGYLSEAINFLTDSEIENMAFAPRLITFTIGLRFLTDYIDGDKYFKVNRDGQNLDRARAQFKLVESNESNFEEMKRMVEILVRKYKNKEYE